MKTRTNPALIRAALLDARRSSIVTAAENAGVAFSTVAKWQQYAAAHPGWPADHDIATWRRNEADRATQRRHDHESAKRRILAGQPLLTDPTGARRRTRALLALGWTRVDISNATKLTAKHIGRLAGDTPLQTVQLSTHTAIAGAFETMSMTQPAGGHHDHQRRESAVLGYHPPLAWDNIDDPADRPNYSGRTRRDTLICYRAVTAAAHLYDASYDAVFDETYDPLTVTARTAAIGAASQLGVPSIHIAGYLGRHPSTVTNALARITTQPDLAAAVTRLHRRLTRPVGLQRTAIDTKRPPTASYHPARSTAACAVQP